MAINSLILAGRAPSAITWPRLPGKLVQLGIVLLEHREVERFLKGEIIIAPHAECSPPNYTACDASTVDWYVSSGDRPRCTTCGQIAMDSAQCRVACPLAEVPDFDNVIPDLNAEPPAWSVDEARRRQRPPCRGSAWQKRPASESVAVQPKCRAARQRTRTCGRNCRNDRCPAHRGTHRSAQVKAAVA
jgi:hypothetical protein